MSACLGIVTLCLSLSAGAASHTPAASELLDEYARALRAARSFISKSEVVSRQEFEFDAHFDTHWLGTTEPVSTGGLELHLRVEFRTDGERTRRMQLAWGDVGLRDRGVDEARPSYFFSNWDGADYYVHSCVANDPVRRGVMQLGGIGKDQWETQFIRHSESWLLGYHGDERLDAILHRARSLVVSNVMETVGGSACYVLTGKTDSGTFSLWIDPQHGYNAAKVKTCVVTGNRRFNNKITTTTRLENVRFEAVDGTWVPMEADTLKQVDFNIDGKKGMTHEESHHKRTEFVLNPDHTALGSFSKPAASDRYLMDETTVHKHGDPASYIWRAGKIVRDQESFGHRPVRRKPRRWR